MYVCVRACVRVNEYVRVRMCECSALFCQNILGTAIALIVKFGTDIW